MLLLHTYLYVRVLRADVQMDPRSVLPCV